jgi:hypothetical protein
MPTREEIVKFYSEHADDPAAIAAAMKQYGVGAREASEVLGTSQQDFVAHVNSGRVATPVMSSGWDGGDTGARTWNYDAITPEVTQSLDQFKQKYAHAIWPDGRFKGPQSGIDYAAEGMTPEEYYKARIGQQYQRSGEYGLEQTPTVFNTEVNADWRPGPDNGGGVLGGLGRAVTGIVKGVMSNPALSAAATAGLGSFLGSGVTSSGWYKPAVAAGKTALSGGNIGDAVKGAALSYAGSAAGDATKGIIGGAMGQVVGGVVKGAVTGQDLVSSLASGVTSAGINAFSANIPGFDELGDVQKSLLKRAITTALRRKKITPQLISSVMSDAAAAVSKSKRG